MQAGLGLSDERFNLDRIHSLPAFLDTRDYQAWVASAEERLERIIERSLEGTANNGPRRAPG